MKSFPLKPRFCETDAIGHINNTSIAVWFETGRIDYLSAIVLASGEDQPTWFMASQTIDYLDENFFGTEVRLDMSIVHIGNSSFSVGCKIYQEGRHTVRARATLVYISDETRKPTRIPDKVRAALEAELDQDWQ